MKLKKHKQGIKIKFLTVFFLMLLACISTNSKTYGLDLKLFVEIKKAIDTVKDFNDAVQKMEDVVDDEYRTKKYDNTPPDYKKWANIAIKKANDIQNAPGLSPIDYSRYNYTSDELSNCDTRGDVFKKLRDYGNGAKTLIEQGEESVGNLKDGEADAVRVIEQLRHLQDIYQLLVMASTGTPFETTYFSAEEGIRIHTLPAAKKLKKALTDRITSYNAELDRVKQYAVNVKSWLELWNMASDCRATVDIQANFQDGIVVISSPKELRISVSTAPAPGKHGEAVDITYAVKNPAGHFSSINFYTNKWQSGIHVSYQAEVPVLFSVRLPLPEMTEPGVYTFYVLIDDNADNLVDAVQVGRSGWVYDSIGVVMGNRFIDNGDFTITDYTTGLLWQKYDSSRKDWYESKEYCNKLDLAGTGWRMPTIEELATITDWTIRGIPIDYIYFPKTYRTIYWSSTTKSTHPSLAWGMRFWPLKGSRLSYYSGIIGSIDAPRHYLLGVKCTKNLPDK